MGVEIKTVQEDANAVELQILASKDDKVWNSPNFIVTKQEGDTVDSIKSSIESKIDKYYKSW
tara:strand:- start:1181 stop:1366 length:186 start_codon:yes stop_codon:yes gene_type:complete